MSDQPWKWDVFISYAQEPDKALAKILRDRLQAFGKAPFALRRTRVFLDKASLSASADLPESLRGALRQSRTFLVLCSPEAARSEWVAREGRMWLDTHGARKVLLALTAGRLTWRNGDFRREDTDALPAPFYGKFADEPLWVDVAWWRGHPDPARAPELDATVARLAAAILELPLDEIEGDDVRSRRLLKRLRTAAIAALVILTVLSVGLAVWAEVNRRTAVRQREVAMQRALAISAQAAVVGEPSLANAQRAAAYVAAVNPSARGPETWRAAFGALQSLPTAVLQHDAGISDGAFAPHGSDFALASGSTVSLHDVTGRARWTTTLPHDAGALAWAPSGHSLLAVGRSPSVTLLRSNGSVIRTMQWDVQAQGAGAAAPPRAVLYPEEEFAVVITDSGFVVIDVTRGAVRTRAASVDRLTTCGLAAVWSQPDGAVQVQPLQDLSHASEPRIVHRHQARVTFLACADAGGSVGSVGADDEVVWSRANRTTRARLHGVRSLALSSAGDRLAVNTSMVQQTGRLDTSTGRNETLLFADRVGAPIWRAPHSLFSTSLSFHGDDLFVADDTSALMRVDARRAGRIDRLATGDQIDHLIGLSRPGDVLVVTKDGKILEVDFVTASRRPLGRTTGWATKATVSKDRRSVLLFSRFNSSDVQDEREAAVVVAADLAPGPLHFETAVETAARAGTSEVMSLRARPDGWSEIASTPLITSGVGQSMRVRGRFESLVMSRDGVHAALWGNAGALLTRMDGREVWRDPGSTTESQFIGGGAAMLLRSEAPELLFVAEGRRVALPFQTGNVGTVKVTPDLQFAAVIADDHHQLWELSGRNKVYDAPPNASWSAAFAPDGSRFVAAVKRGGLDIVELSGAHRVRHIPVPLTIEGELVFSESNRDVLVPGREGLARVNLSTGAVTSVDTVGRATWIVVAPLGRGLVVADPDQVVRLMDVANRLVGRIQLSGTLGAVAFNDDGSLVALGSHDGGVRLVDVITGRLLADIRADTGAVTELTFLWSESWWLLIGGGTRASLVPVDPYSRLCERAIRRLSTEEWLEVGGSGPTPTACQ